MANFDLVNQFASMRTGVGSGLTPIDVYRPTPVANPSIGGVSSTPTVPSGNSSATGLVDWNGKKVHSSVVPYFEQLSTAFPGLRFSGGYRDPETNKKVNGVPNSWHLQGKAGDFSGAPKDMYAAQAWAKAHGAKEALVHNAGSGLHLHVAWH